MAVSQEHPLGCAVACVAFRLGIPYADALACFSTRKNAWTRGFFCAEVVAALDRAGLRYAWETFDPAKHERVIEKNGTIVFIDPCEAYPSGHYLIRSAYGWMNPWANFPLMIPAEAGFQEMLPGKIVYVIFESISLPLASSVFPLPRG